jgi:hypothetical protein
MFRRINFRVLNRSFSTPSMGHAASEPAKSSTMKMAGIALLAFGGIYFIGNKVGVSRLQL